MKKHLRLNRVDVALILLSCIQALTSTPLAAQSTQKIVSGYSHSIAIKSNGSLWVWGSNSQGQLGNGGNGDIWYPIPVSGFTNVKDVAGGYQHSLAIKNNGTVWAWGYNNDGELGDGSTIQRTSPVQVIGLSNIVNVGAGYFHSFAIKGNGTLYTWGKNDKGQLGIGNTFNIPTPIQVTGISAVSDATGGEIHSVVLKTDGTVWTWGYNGEGELGNGTTSTIPQTVPVQIGGGFNNVMAVSAGRYHTLALKNDGTLWVWGKNNKGQVGNGTATNQLSPIQVLYNVLAIAAGENHSLAVKNDGTLWAWGYNGQGQLGDGTTTDRMSPVQIGTLTTWKSLSAGNYSLAAKSDDSIWGWGINGNGQIGNNLNANSSLPLSSLFTFTTKVNLPTFSPDGGSYIFFQRVKITCSTPEVTIYYTLNGNDPTQSDQPIPSGSKIKINNGSTILKARAFKNGMAASDVKIAVFQVGERVITGYSHSMAIKSDTMLWVWGSNSQGQLANSSTGLNKLIPFKLTNISGLLDAAAGYEYSLALKKDGTVWAWGANSEGQLGNASTTQQTSPVQVASLSGIINIGAGYYHSLAIKADGTLWGWGKNSSGQLGNGNTSNSLTAIQVIGLTGVIDVAGGEGHSLALRSEGTAWAWGSNSEGQLGDGTQNSRITPVQVIGGQTNLSIIAIAVGRSHSLALKSDGTVWAWGRNNEGQIGIGNFVSPQLKPVPVSGLSNIIAIAAGEYHSLALKNDGTVWAWGFDGQGQLGNGFLNTNQTIPTEVIVLTGTTSLSAGTHSLAITPEEEVFLYFAWGDNNNGQLGDSSTTPSNFRVLVQFPVDENGNGIPDWQDYIVLSNLLDDGDQDGLESWKEIWIHGTSITNFDCNVDGLADGVNVFVGYPPLNPDTDGDGISNEEEPLSGTNPIDNDTDVDGSLDGLDAFPLDPLRTSLPPLDLSDHTAPAILLQEPPGAIIIE